MGRRLARASAEGLRLHRSPLVRAALFCVRARGIDVMPIVARYQLSPQILVERECVMPLGAYRALMAECARRAEILNLGVHLAASLPRGYLGVFELSAGSAPTLREAARRFVRYLPLMSPLLRARLDETDELVTLRQWIDGEPEAQGPHANEYVPAALVRHIRELVGDDAEHGVEIEEVLLAHREPADRSALTAFFGKARLIFGTGYNGISVRRALMERPQLAANEVLMRALDEHASWLLSSPAQPSCPSAAAAQPAGDDRFVEAVRHAILSNLTHSEALLPRVAEVMGMTPRTLQRRLRVAGWSFRGFVDGLRREAAQQLACGGQRSISEVAYLLGYTELSSFRRASRRWRPS
jgi:AraC-like DNA-binding protein